ncbi:MAG: hypothetical protein ABIM88_05150 [candidate division WOR-3 bacterium]
MHIKLHFNFKDVLRAPRCGLSVKKMWVQFLGIIIGLILYVPLTYLAYSMAGFKPYDIWRFYHLLPIPVLTGEYLVFGLKSQIVWWLGVVLFGVVQLFTGVAISKIAYEQFKGDELYEVSKAMKLALRKGKATVLAPLTLLVLSLVLLGIEVGVFYLGRIPAAGGVIDAILFLFFLFVSLFIIYVMIGFAVSLFVVAPAVATTQADTFDALFETFSILNEQNWRFIVYQVILLIVKAVALIIFGFFLTWSAKLTFWAMGFGYPQALFAHDVAVRFVDCFSLSIWSLRFMDAVSLSKFFALTGHAATAKATIAAGTALGVVYYIILFILLSYLGAMCWSGQTLIYIVLYKKKDDIDLLAQRPEALEEVVVEKEKPGEGAEKEPGK